MDFFDKSKKRSRHIKKINDKLIRVDARAPIEEVNKFLNLGIEEKRFETLAGFIEHKLHRIPKKGEKKEGKIPKFWDGKTAQRIIKTLTD